MRRYIDDLIMPWYEATLVSDTAEKANKTELITKIAEPQLPKFGPKIKKLFKKMSASGGVAAKTDGPESVDCSEFLTFCKNCKLCDSNFSMSDALSVYMYCNPEEMQ